MTYFKSEFENQVFADQFNGKLFINMTLDELEAAKVQAETAIKCAAFCDRMSEVRDEEESAYRILNSANRELKKRKAEAAIGGAWAALFTQAAA